MKNPAIVYQSATQTVKPTHPVSEKTRKVAKNTKENEKQIPSWKAVPVIEYILSAKH